jgi:hypothetical protein
MVLKSKSAISNVLKGRSKTSCNFYWVYESDFLNNSYELKTRVDPKESKGIKHYQYCPDTFKLIKTHLSIRDLFQDIRGVYSNDNALKKAIKDKTT